MNAPYFEGWYYKVTTPQVAFAIIIGIAKNTLDQHAFIQTIDTVTKQTHYYRYELCDVHIEENPFSIRIQDNCFTNNHIQLHVQDMFIDVSMDCFTALHSTLYAPTIMGPFAYYKHMQCVHSIISLQHQVKGTWIYNDKTIEISGVGYIEKDRGVSFPKEYLWLQANTLNHSCIFLSIAHIPIGKTSFTGCICVFMIDDKQYCFASYYGVRIKEMKIEQCVTHKEVSIVLCQFAYRLQIKLIQNQAYPLLAPDSGVMEPKVFESLDGEVDVQLFHHNKLMYDTHFSQVGSEIRF